MSNWSKVEKVNQRVHRERHQPDDRKKLGLLEKKKDYKARANDYNRKRAIIRRLKRKAEHRNPDEYYFHMVNSKVIDGKHHEKRWFELDDYTPEQKKLMESQDLNYIRMKRNQERNKIEKLKTQVNFKDFEVTKPVLHLKFTESDDDNDCVSSSSSSDEEVAAEAGNQSEIECGDDKADDDDDFDMEDLDEDVEKEDAEEVEDRQNEDVNLTANELQDSRAIRAHKEQLCAELAKRIDREHQLALIERRMELKKRRDETDPFLRPKLLRKGTRFEAPVYQWPYQRKR